MSLGTGLVPLTLYSGVSLIPYSYYQELTNAVLCDNLLPFPDDSAVLSVLDLNQSGYVIFLSVTMATTLDLYMRPVLCK